MQQLGYGQPRARWVLTATVLGSGIAQVDSSVVNVALPTIGRQLGAGIGGLAWVVNGYTLTLASLILLGGSLGDRFGRRRVFTVGVVWFAVASLACAAATTLPVLIAARALQGVGGALLTPGSLAILQASFRPEDRARAIGAWSGLGGIAGAVAPLLGGWLVGAASWHWIFLINAPVAGVVLLAARHIPESRDAEAGRRPDLLGAALAAAGLGALTYALTTWGSRRTLDASVGWALALAVLALAGFLLRERRAAEPLLPPGLFADRVFSATNAVTFAVYAALAGVFFWLVLQLQVVAGFSPLRAGLALLPVTLLLLALSARAGAWGQRFGPGTSMTVGPAVCAVAVLAMGGIGPGAGYWSVVLWPVVLFGLGLAITVAPLTAAVLGAAPERHTGVASGVNNAVARAASLLAVAALPLLAGLSGEAYTDPAAMTSAFRHATWICAGLFATGALVAAGFLRRRPPDHPAALP